jgi:hypothetical protein
MRQTNRKTDKHRLLIDRPNVDRQTDRVKGRNDNFCLKQVWLYKTSLTQNHHLAEVSTDPEKGNLLPAL